MIYRALALPVVGYKETEGSEDCIWLIVWLQKEHN